MKINTNNTLRQTVTTAAAVALMGAGAAFADAWGDTHVTTTADGVRSVAVSYSDLDLNDVEGRDTLEYRVRAAAREVCGSTDYRITGSLSQANQNKECAERAVNAASYNSGASEVAVASR
jgi:UrcA family protein